MAASQAPSTAGDNEPESGSLRALIVCLVIGLIWSILWFVDKSAPGGIWSIPQALFQVAVISIVIWQACDPFADAAQWIGEKFRLPGSVRGATLDAVASSLPELFTGIFFVVYALQLVAGDKTPEETAALLEGASVQGYGSTIATCAGSAVYNMILIPAFCALVISWSRPERPTIDVEDEVIARDGVWFLCTQIVLIMFLFQDSMTWWMALAFLLLYVLYITQLYTDALKYRDRLDALKAYFCEFGPAADTADVVIAMQHSKIRVSASLVEKARARHIREGTEDDSDEADTAGLFFGFVQIPLNGLTTSLILVAATGIVAVTCYYLVEATVHMADLLNVPAFFVAVIIAAAASSVPDTLLAIAAARRGDDSGAVSNAFGSNIFDICVCMSVPLLLNSWLLGWKPVSLLQDGRPIPGLVGLRVLLVVLTIINLAIMWHNRQITRRKAWVMCGLYAIFVTYAIAGSLGYLV